MHPFVKHNHWSAVQAVYEKLTGAGYQALLAGGCVRDLLMNRVPNDFDFATNARPEAVEALFEKALTVGREFGVTILPFDGFHIEVATFRKDGPYLDGRHPSHIVFSTPEEDAERRDFTVNALFYDIGTQKVIDYVNGQADIRARLIRAVGDPDRRFDEDKLRILRAVRFAAQLDFTVEAHTLAAVRARHRQIAMVSQERIRDELNKLLKCGNVPRGLRLLHETGLLAIVLPELQAAFSHAEVLARTESRLQGGVKSVEEGLCRLLFDAFKFLEATVAGPARPLEIIRALLKRLRFSNQEIDAVVWVLQREDLFVNSLAHRRAEVIRALAHPNAPLAESFYANVAELDPQAPKLWAEVHQKSLDGSRRLPERLIDGSDLLKIGIPKGPLLGRILEEAFNLQLEGTLRSRDEALAWAKTQIPTK